MICRPWLSLAVVLALAILAFPMRSPACAGDCNESGTVTAADLTRMVALILRCDGNVLGCPQAQRPCPAGDINGNGRLDVGDLVAVIDQLLTYPSGCPSAPTAPSATPSPPPTPTSSVTATATSTRTPTPPVPSTTPTPTPTVAPAVCGNGVVEPGETCDDGNTVTNPPSDRCPGDCTVLTCSPSSERFEVAVQLTAPRSVASIAVTIVYPDGTLQLPGTATDNSVGARLLNRPSGFLADWFDFDYAVRVALVGTRALSSNLLFRIQFDVCRGATAPPRSALSCTVTEANDTNFQPVPGTTCSVVVP